uniref:Chromo domain-containing protein n=1 Tax=Meloidogyne javanica TaxID=6303 RepID=A0A915MYH0_MELJA
MDVDEEIDVVTNTDDVNGVVASGDDEDDKEYEVEKILKQKRERGKTLFLVRWRGYGPSDDSWEPQENLVDGAQDVLDAFLEEQAQLKKKGVKRLGSENNKTPQTAVESRVRNNVFQSWLDSDEDDEERLSVVDGKNDIKNDNDDKVKDENGDLELKLNTSGNSEDDKNKVNGKIVENGEVDGKGSVRKDNKKDSPPPPTDPEENGEDNSKAKAAISASLRRRSTTVEKTEVKNSVSNNISAKEVSKQKKNKNEREVDVDKEKGEKPSSEFRIDVMFRDNVGKLKLVANLGMTSECQITINAQLEKELAMFLKTKIKPGGPRKNKNIVSDDDSDG